MTNFAKLKKSKFFAPPDLIVYGLIVLLIIGLFIGFLGNSGSDFGGVAAFVSENGESKEIFSYSFDNDKLFIADEWKAKVTVERGENIVTVTFLFGDERNVLVLDTAEKTAIMTDADCSAHRDCTKFAAIKNANGVIICIPHKLTIVGTGAVDLQPSVG